MDEAGKPSSCQCTIHISLFFMSLDGFNLHSKWEITIIPPLQQYLVCIIANQQSFDIQAIRPCVFHCLCLSSSLLIRSPRTADRLLSKLIAHRKGAAWVAALLPYCMKGDTASEECYLLLNLSLATREANYTKTDNGLPKKWVCKLSTVASKKNTTFY